MKKTLIILLVLATVCTLFACDKTGKLDINLPFSVDGEKTSEGSGEEFIYGDGTSYIAEHLKGSYSIKYKYSTASSQSSGDEAIIQEIHTDDGVYFNFGDSEMMYVKINGEYYFCSGSSEEGFVVEELYGAFPLENIELMGSMLTGFMTQYGNYATGMKADGTETVAGRRCNKYTYSLGLLGMGVNYTYSIDTETGVCMKYTFDVAAAGETGSLTYECLEFKVGGVSLPPYSRVGSGEDPVVTSESPEPAPVQTPTPTPVAPVTPIVSSGSLSLDALKLAVTNAGFSVDNDFYSSLWPVAEPIGGFSTVFTVGGSFQIDFMEFATDSDAAAYKASEDEPTGLFPTMHYVSGRFLARYSLGFSADADIEAFVKSIFAAAGGLGSSTDIQGTVVSSGGLTLDTLKQAAINAGFDVDNSTASSSDFEGTTPRPVRGFCIASSGSSSLDIYVNEFASETEAIEYAAYVNGHEYGSGAAFYSGKFVLQFSGYDAYTEYPALIAVFEAVGWN